VTVREIIAAETREQSELEPGVQKSTGSEVWFEVSMLRYVCGRRLVNTENPSDCATAN
jgi:hypothetical protein